MYKIETLSNKTQITFIEINRTKNGDTNESDKARTVDEIIIRCHTYFTLGKSYFFSMA